MYITSEITDGGHFAHEMTAHVAEANAFRVLATALGPPAEMDVNDPVELASVFDRFDQDFKNLGKQAAEAWQVGLQHPDTLAVAYAKLFLGPFDIMAPAYGSFYLEPNQKIMGEISRYAADAYQEASLRPRSGIGEAREAPDHICCELEFMYFLAFQYVTTGEHIWRARRERFWNEHLALWLPHFCDTMFEADSHQFYNAVSRLLSQFLLDSSAVVLGRNLGIR